MKKFLSVLAAAAMLLTAATAHAYSVKVDDDTFGSVGVRGQIRIVATNPDVGVGDVDVTVHQLRLYASGQVTNLVKFGSNADFTTTGARATDAFVTLDFSKEAKLMTGVYRVAFTRVGLQDAYQFILIDAPAVVNAVAPVNRGGFSAYRNAGVTLWGDLMDGKLRYNVGVWDDDNTPLGTGEGTSKYMYTTRLVLNLADPEKGYTCPGCYLGKANVINIGIGYLSNEYTFQGVDRTNRAKTIDFFYDRAGTTLETAYISSDPDTGRKPGAWYIGAAHMFGNWQPAVRYESFDSDGSLDNNNKPIPDFTVMTAGVNYLWDGHNAKLQLAYSLRNPDGANNDTETLTCQLQIQF